MRKLASVQCVHHVEPIEGADRIELAHVLGWQCVVNKGVFKPMDLGVYFEIDSFLPIRDEFEFLRASSYKKTDIMGEGFRLKTMRFKGQISQGLLLPLSMFPQIPQDAGAGDDVTELLGVRKWEIEERATTGGNIMGTLPYDVPHTDETRCFIGTTKIVTDQGLLRISDIVNKQLHCNVLTYNESTGSIEWNPITRHFKRKSVESICTLTYPFKFNENRTNRLSGTLDHKVLTQNGWTELKDVSIGDRIFIPSNRYTQDVIPVVAGMLLGDSHLMAETRTQKDGRVYNRRRIAFTQGERQLSYLKEKLRILGVDSNIRIAKSGYCDNNVYQTSTKIDDTIEEWIMSVIGNSKQKRITKEYVDALTPVSLAFWYMDDGALHRYTNSGNWQSQISLCTEAYTLEENELLAARLKEFGVHAKVYTEKKGEKEFYILHLSTNATKAFQNIIAKYVYPEMRYKLDDEYKDVDYALKEYVVKKELSLIPVQVLAKEIKQPTIHSTNNVFYNIETTPNHNYFANRILVHNCQAAPELIQEFAGLEYYISTKMDGSSHSISVDENGFHVTGHNYEYKDDDSCAFYRLVNERNYREKIEDFVARNNIRTLTIQGEFCAPGIQKNRLRLTRPEWYVFTVKENGKRVGLHRMLEVCDAIGLNHVPIEEVGTDLPSKYPTVEALLERADGEYPNGGKKEGIVIRPTEPVHSPTVSGCLSMKVVSNKYLLKNE